MIDENLELHWFDTKEIAEKNWCLITKVFGKRNNWTNVIPLGKWENLRFQLKEISMPYQSFYESEDL
jgi:hypothetical protein